MVRMAPTMAVPSLLREFDADPGPLLAEFGLTPSGFDDPEFLLDYEGRSRLLARCAEAASCPHFGLLVGQRAGLSSFGPVGFLMQSAPDLRAALAVLPGNFRLHNPNAQIELVEADGYARFSHTVLGQDCPGQEQVADMSAAIMVNALRHLCGHGGHPVEIRLPRARPRDIAPYRRFFQAPLRFDTIDTGLLIPVSWLDRPLPAADPLLHHMMRQRIDALASQAVEDVSRRLQRLLPSLLAARRADVGTAAQSLGLGVRTLNRRLADEGTSYALLRDEARYSMGRQLLRDTAMPVSEIADHLGYAYASAFTAAFRRWSGTCPLEWRAANPPARTGERRGALGRRTSVAVTASAPARRAPRSDARRSGRPSPSARCPGARAHGCPSRCIRCRARRRAAG